MAAVAKAATVTVAVAVAVTATFLLERRMKERCLDENGRSLAGRSHHALVSLQAVGSNLVGMPSAAMKHHLLVRQDFAIAALAKAVAAADGKTGSRWVNLRKRKRTGIVDAAS